MSRFNPNWQSIPAARLTREERTRHKVETLAAERILALYERPVTRGDCLTGGVNGERPCPWLSCKEHLGLEVTDIGTIRLHKDWDDGRPTCALDEAAREGISLDEIGKVLNITRERVRQIEERALIRVRRVASKMHEDEGAQEEGKHGRRSTL